MSSPQEGATDNVVIFPPQETQPGLTFEVLVGCTGLSGQSTKIYEVWVCMWFEKSVRDDGKWDS